MLLDNSEDMTRQVDELNRVYASSVISDHERMVRNDIIAWANKNGMATHRLYAQAEAYWNERLN